MTGEERAEEIPFALPKLAFEPRGAEAGKQYGRGEGAALGSEPLRERSTAGADLAEELAEPLRLRRYAPCG
jgi:hypothetical protein